MLVLRQYNKFVCRICNWPVPRTEHIRFVECDAMKYYAVYADDNHGYGETMIFSFDLIFMPFKPADAV